MQTQSQIVTQESTHVRRELAICQTIRRHQYVKPSQAADWSEFFLEHKAITSGIPTPAHRTHIRFPLSLTRIGTRYRNPTCGHLRSHANYHVCNYYVACYVNQLATGSWLLAVSKHIPSALQCLHFRWSLLLFTVRCGCLFFFEISYFSVRNR